MNNMKIKERTIKISEPVYKRILRIARRDKRTIKATVELAFDYKEGFIKN